MKTTSHFATAAVLILTASAAQAQYYGAPAPQPFYSAAVQPGQAYAIEVAPNTYVIQRGSQTQTYPYVGGTPKRETKRGVRKHAEPEAVQRRSNAVARTEQAPQPAQNPKRFDRPLKPNDPKLIEELRQRHDKKTYNTKQVVYDKPVVIETQRIVDDPPRVIERRHYVDGPIPPGTPPVTVEHEAAPPVAGKKGRVVREDRRGGDDGGKRVINAEAEVTILGPDRMSIRLFRKGQGRGANASAVSSTE